MARRSPEQYRREYERRIARRPGVSAREAAGHRPVAEKQARGQAPSNPIEALRHPERWQGYIRRHPAALRRLAETPLGYRILLRQALTAYSVNLPPVFAVPPAGIRARRRPAAASRGLREAYLYIGQIQPDGWIFSYIVPESPAGWRVWITEDSEALLTQMEGYYLERWGVNPTRTTGTGRVVPMSVPYGLTRRSGAS